MEMQPDQGCCHPGLLGNGLCHDGLHNLLCLWARLVVELWEQAIPWIGTDGTCKEERADHTEHHQATHGSRHVKGDVRYCTNFGGHRMRDDYALGACMAYIHVGAGSWKWFQLFPSFATGPASLFFCAALIGVRFLKKISPWLLLPESQTIAGMCALRV